MFNWFAAAAQNCRRNDPKSNYQSVDRSSELIHIKNKYSRENQSLLRCKKHLRRRL